MISGPFDGSAVYLFGGTLVYRNSAKKRNDVHIYFLHIVRVLLNAKH